MFGTVCVMLPSCAQAGRVHVCNGFHFCVKLCLTGTGPVRSWHHAEHTALQQLHVGALLLETITLLWWRVAYECRCCSVLCAFLQLSARSFGEGQELGPDVEAQFLPLHI